MNELFNYLVAQTGMDPDDLKRVIQSAPRRYKIFEIDKRGGGKREIAQPARELKRLQRILMWSMLEKLPVHPAATAYRTGLSIRDNALPHAGGGPILKMDFENFFPSIRSEDWIAYCNEHGFLTPDERQLTARIFFRQAPLEQILKLSVGAPSSPMLSNILMYPFDVHISDEAARRRINYTRYADDMTFSGQRAGMLKDMIKEVERAVRGMARPKLKVNDDKTTFITAARRRWVTGAVLANDGSIGIGHAKKRLLSARVHYAITGRLNDDELRSLAGELAFAKVVDPTFIDWLNAKYGADKIRWVKRLGRT